MARKLAHDKVLFLGILALLGIGLVMVYSASAVLAHADGTSVNTYFLKQVAAALLGLLAMGVAMHVDYRELRRPAVVYGLLGVVMLTLVAALFAPTLNNTRRWLYLGGVSFQPSELAKLALVVYVAYQLDRKADRVNSVSLLVPCAFATTLAAGLILLGRDLGSALLVLVPPFVMVYLAGLSWRLLVIGGTVVAPMAAVAVLLEPYRLRRLLAFIDPEKDPLGWGFQPLQSLIAIGSGGLTGLGPGNSVQKLYFLPSPHADFIFSIIAEELGFLGAAVILGLLGLLLWRGLAAGTTAPDTFGRYLAWGLTTLIVVQALLHVSVALSILPTKGIPLPLVSHGGSSMLVTLLACGLLLNISQHA